MTGPMTENAKSIMLVVSNTDSLRKKYYGDDTRFNLVFVRITFKPGKVFKGEIIVMTLTYN